jgi:CheY-like chemotaxis protein/signal transduction histidine kinase
MHFKTVKSVILGSSLVTCVNAGDFSEIENLNFWVALVALAAVSLLILFISSRQSRRLQALHQSLFDKQLEMEKNQNILLTTMSENIHNIAKQAIEEGRQVLNTPAVTAEVKEEMFANVENRLLDVTNDLIDFLRLKSKKVDIINEEFNINNVLNEVSGTICSRFAGSQCELIFDIDKNIPRRLIGDSLHIGQILESILEYQMDQANLTEVKLEISMFDTYADNIEMQFKVTDTGIGLTTDAIENLFTPYYDEELGSYVGLGLFVSNELVTMMDGKLSVQSTIGKGSTFTLAIPLKVVDKENKRMYRLPKKVLIEKKVLIVDDNYNSALAIKKMFAYFRHDVTVLTPEEFRRNIPNLTPYDIIVLHESLFTHRLVEYITKIKMGKSLKVIALNALLRANKSSFVDDVLDMHLFKPLNQERIFELIVNLYGLKDVVTPEVKKEASEKQISTHKAHILETKDITQERFKDFKGKNLLIVEDNLINQKVLTNLFYLSEINITIANNGQEAVDIVKEGKIKFDLVLMDINMPIMDGYTATQMIRLDTKFDLLPIVAFTALVLDSEIKKMFHSGVNAFLAKPLNIGKLYTAMAIYLLDVPLSQVQLADFAPREIKNYAGINIEEGITRSNNSEALYIEVLKEFSEAYGESDKTFASLVKEHRYEQIKMLCLDMKGLSGAIGAHDMHDLMTEIIQLLLYKKYELIANYQEKYIFEIQTLNRSIKQFLSDI